MTIKNRVKLAITIQAIPLLVICMFIYLSFKTVSSRLKFIERIDDINISCLEMRKAEKNYFLYNDQKALVEVIERGKDIHNKIISSEHLSDEILIESYNSLMMNLDLYIKMARNLINTPNISSDFQVQFRGLGHKITQLSEQLLMMVRKNVNEIILANSFKIIISLGVIFLFQLILWQYFSKMIFRELTRMQQLIKMVSEGRIHEVAIKKVTSDNEINMAIKALANMAKELEKREIELLQAKKLASVGVLISGVAHELGNPLNNISMLAQTYLNIYDMLGDEEKKVFMSDVINQTERIKKIIYKLLDFSRQKKPSFEECNPREIIERSVELVANQIKISNVKLHLDIADDLPMINADAAQIEQVLVNLFINAIQAMPNGGDLFVSLENGSQDDQLVMKIRDTGVGISQDIISNIFDPFFTTKGTRGTGLGLSVSYGIIKEHHGDISVEAKEGQGTTFIIQLPAIKGKGEGHVQENYRH